jgi:hypothetical protein
MRIVLIAMMTALLVFPAQARGKRGAGQQQPNSAEQQQKTKAEEAAYKDALHRIPDQKPADPWGKVR